MKHKEHFIFIGTFTDELNTAPDNQLRGLRREYGIIILREVNNVRKYPIYWPMLMMG